MQLVVAVSGRGNPADQRNLCVLLCSTATARMKWCRASGSQHGITSLNPPETNRTKLPRDVCWVNNIVDLRNVCAHSEAGDGLKVQCTILLSVLWGILSLLCGPLAEDKKNEFRHVTSWRERKPSILQPSVRQYAWTRLAPHHPHKHVAKHKSMFPFRPRFPCEVLSVESFTAPYGLQQRSNHHSLWHLNFLLGSG